ncbi:BAG domain-containing protein [Bombardia bombarda]|uniref:BAG domain-containing protein n=1 Tax=Bombardia bombarda TaxID=252184 RepID=A0AA40CG01_9PEZI|nr:BAG domain-containing protein [Bombardia bombarda]
MAGGSFDHPTAVKVASGGDSASSGAAFANFANITSALLTLPPSLQPYIENSLIHLSRATEYLQTATGLSPTALYTTAGAVFLVGAIPAVVARAGKNSKKGGIMSRYGWSARPGLSPFNSTLGPGGVPSVTDDDFSYITSEDLETHGLEIPQSRAHHSREVDHYAHSAPGPASGFLPRPEDDVMLIKHKGVTYPEHFPAYAIGDGKLLVGDVRERIKMVMDLTERQGSTMRLLYKGRELKDLDAPVREYGVKNNSEVMVVLSDSVVETTGSRQTSGGSSTEEIVVVGLDGRDDFEASGKARKPRRGRKRDDRSPRDSGSTLALEVPVEDDRKRGVSRIRTKSPSSASGVSGVSASTAPPVITGRPGGPIEKVNAIGSHFSTKLVPLCVQFTANPPSDPKKRDDEHRKLSEVVMAQVLLKLDEIDTGDEAGARNVRKELVRYVQEVLKSIDEKVK